MLLYLAKNMGVLDGGGEQSQSGNIRFTVGQYWLIIKLNGTNSVNFGTLANHSSKKAL
jgi:hypothetical protein